MTIGISFFNIHWKSPQGIHSIYNSTLLHQRWVILCLNYIDGFVQNCGKLIANAEELLCFLVSKWGYPDWEPDGWCAVLCMVEMDQTVIELWLDVWAGGLTPSGNGEHKDGCNIKCCLTGSGISTVEIIWPSICSVYLWEINQQMRQKAWVT